MITDNRIMFVLLSFLAVGYCADLQSMASGNEEARVETSSHSEGQESTTAVATEVRTGRQYYQPSMGGFVYQPYMQPQRRAYRGPIVQPKNRPSRKTPARRPGRPGVRPKLPPMTMQMNRYRRFPPPLRTQQVNYIDSAGGGLDYDYESAAPQAISLDYGEQRPGFEHEPAAAYLPTVSGRSRKRPTVTAMAGYADEPQAVVHVPVRVQVRPALPAATTAATAHSMDKLRQLVHEAMNEHFANRHQELYANGFDKQHPVQYSAKYKRQQANKEKQQQHQEQQQTTDAIKSSAVVVPLASSSSATRDASFSSRDVDADGSDDRLTLAEISAYMGAKPEETILSAGGHRYVLSDALQHSYRIQQQQQQQQQQQHQQQQQQQQYVGEDHRDHLQQQYLRYVSPFEAIYELPAARWTYK